MVRDAREHALAGWVCRTDRLIPWCAPRGVQRQSRMSLRCLDTAIRLDSVAVLPRHFRSSMGPGAVGL